MSNTINLVMIEARANAATPGPWSVVHFRGDYTLIYGADGVGTFLNNLAQADNIPDAEFIAHAREDIPALLAYIDSLHQMLDGMGL